jgi:hypothetical protein
MVLPRARRYALDRVLTLDELREILDAADIRGKALTLIFTSKIRQYNTSLSLRLPSTTHYHKDCNLLAHKKPTHNY